jgi:hypothetical protein
VAPLSFNPTSAGCTAPRAGVVLSSIPDIAKYAKKIESWPRPVLIGHTQKIPHGKYLGGIWQF